MHAWDQDGYYANSILDFRLQYCHYEQEVVIGRSPGYSISIHDSEAAAVAGDYRTLVHPIPAEAVEAAGRPGIPVHILGRSPVAARSSPVDTDLVVGRILLLGTDPVAGHTLLPDTVPVAGRIHPPGIDHAAADNLLLGIDPVGSLRRTAVEGEAGMAAVAVAGRMADVRNYRSLRTLKKAAVR